MSIIISGAPYRIGPGSTINCQISAGPNPNDDFASILVQTNGTFQAIIGGTILLNGTLFPQVVLGWDARNGRFETGDAQVIQDGTAIDVIVTHYHHNFVAVQSTTYTNTFTWSKVGYTHALLNFLNASGGALDQILQAVKRTYPST